MGDALHNLFRGFNGGVARVWELARDVHVRNHPHVLLSWLFQAYAVGTDM